MKSQFRLLRARRFLPLFLTQFCGAFNDNLFKNALVILILYRLAEPAGLDGRLVVTAAAGLFILPFVLFSPLAGHLADRLDKAWLIRRVKLAEIAIMAAGALALWQGGVYSLLAVLFVMGSQSAFFGPLKYGILPDHLAGDELIGGNGLINAATFLAILLGTIAGGILILGDVGGPTVMVGVVTVAVLGWLASRAIPPAPPRPGADPVRVAPLREIRAVMVLAMGQPAVWGAVIGISWFWLVGATYLAQFPAFGKEGLMVDERVVTLFLTMFSIGIGAGALLCHRLSRGQITLRQVPWGALGMAVFSIDLFLAVPETLPAALRGPGAFLADLRSWRILADLLGLALSGGLYIVPFYALMQASARPESRARVVAANNVMNALFMVASALVAMAVLAAGVSVPALFALLGGANVLVAAILYRFRHVGVGQVVGEPAGD